jgi:hypothetical protein
MYQRMMLGLLCLVLVGTGMACAPKLIGPTASAGAFFTFEVSTPVIILGAYDASAAEYSATRAALLVQVQDGQGRPVDGVPVVFELEPGWANRAVLSPTQTVTRGGLARSIFSQPQSTGVVRITARVDNTPAQTTLLVQSFEERLEQED